MRTDSTPTPFGLRTVVVAGATLRVHGGYGAPRAETTSARRESGAPASTKPASPAPRVEPIGAPARPPEPPGAIRPDDLVPEVRRLLWYHVDSVEKIAVLDHACSAPVAWTTAQAAAALGLPERAAVVATVGLCQAGFLRRSGDTYEATPRATLLGAALDVLRRAYGPDPQRALAAIARLVHGRSTT